MSIRRSAAVRAASLPSLRSVGFGATAVPVSAVSHCLAGGTAPRPATAVLAWALVTMAHRLVLARAERSGLVLATALTVIQIGLHQLFSAVEPNASACHLVPTTPHEATHAGLLSGPMLLAHVVAGAVLGGVLRCGEAALWSTARHLAHRLHHLVHALRALSVDPTTIAGDHDATRLPAWPPLWLDPAARRHRISGGRYWRGPPAVLPGLAVA